MFSYRQKLRITHHVFLAIMYVDLIPDYFVVDHILKCPFRIIV